MVGIAARNIWTPLCGEGSIELIARRWKFSAKTKFFQDPSLTPRNPLSSFFFFSSLGKTVKFKREKIIWMVAVWLICSVSQLFLTTLTNVGGIFQVTLSSMAKAKSVLILLIISRRILWLLQQCNGVGGLSFLQHWPLHTMLEIVPNLLCVKRAKSLL